MSIEENDDEFEFSINNYSCNNNSAATPTSPADHFFMNGRLLPHAFPSQSTNNNYREIYSRSTSRTSSVSSKDSFNSSRSNSTSSCSSARTSTSDNNPQQIRKLALLTNQQHRGINKNITRKSSAAEQWRRHPEKPASFMNYQCRSSITSKRWQFITSVPVIKHNTFCSRRRHEGAQSKRTQSKKQDISKGGSKSSGTWFGLRFFMSFISACMECHSFKQSSSVSL